MKNSKSYRLNVVVTYHKGINVIPFRHLILATLNNLASIFQLDYAMEPDTRVLDTSELNDLETVDLIYFRSTADTPLNRKGLQSLIHTVFHYSQYHQGVEVFCQMQKFLKEFPFPKEFYRCCTYPYVEHHKDGQKRQYIVAAVLDLIHQN